jgi:hypothetical protein
MITMHWFFRDPDTMLYTLNRAAEQLADFHSWLVRRFSPGGGGGRAGSGGESPETARIQDILHRRTVPPNTLLTYSDVLSLPKNFVVPVSTSLVRLELHRCLVSDSDLNTVLANSTHSLQHLGLYDMLVAEQPYLITRLGLATLLANFPRLRSLALRANFLWDGSRDHFVELGQIFRACPNLRTLYIDEGEDQALEWLPPTVETLQFAVMETFHPEDWLHFLEYHGDSLAWRDVLISWSPYSSSYRDASSPSNDGWMEDQWQDAEPQLQNTVTDQLLWAFEQRGIRVLGMLGNASRDDAYLDTGAGDILRDV